VKILKLGMLICGALGIAGMIMIMFGVTETMDADRALTLIMLAAFALPVVMAAIGLARPPLRSWQAGVSLAGFALAGWKLQIWTLFWTLVKHLDEVPMAHQLMGVGAGVGVILTVIAVMKPEEVRPIA
jgi:membrane protease YdiL (CAAX protease family)